jgi:hypothetical protein
VLFVKVAKENISTTTKNTVLPSPLKLFALTAVHREKLETLFVGICSSDANLVD